MFTARHNHFGGRKATGVSVKASPGAHTGEGASGVRMAVLGGCPGVLIQVTQGTCPYSSIHTAVSSMYTDKMVEAPLK